MKQLDFDGVRKVQLEILDYVMNFCEAHGINAFLDGGTLLGCIRHKGYIPWDDDIDTGMLRPDYDKFRRLFNKESTRYRFMCGEDDPDFFFPFGQVMDTQTEKYNPDKATVIKSALCVDVFPIDNAPDDNKQLRKMLREQTCYRVLNSIRIYPNSMPPRGGNIFRRFCAQTARMIMNMIPYSIIPRNFFAVKLTQIPKPYLGQETQRLGSFLGYYPVYIDKSAFSSFVYGEFEGRQYKIPVGYHEWLSKLYGNYMQLPPKEWRVVHHMEAYIKDKEGE